MKVNKLPFHHQILVCEQYVADMRGTRKVYQKEKRNNNKTGNKIK